MYEALNQNIFISLLTLIQIWICSFWIMSTYIPYPFFPNFNAVCVLLAYWTTAYLISEQSSVIVRNDMIIFKSPCLIIVMAKCLVAVYTGLAMDAWSIFEKDDHGQILVIFFFLHLESTQSVPDVRALTYHSARFRMKILRNRVYWWNMQILYYL